MKDTDFHVHAGKESRFAANYNKGKEGGYELADDPKTSAIFGHANYAPAAAAWFRPGGLYALLQDAVAQGRA